MLFHIKDCSDGDIVLVTSPDLFCFSETEDVTPCMIEVGSEQVGPGMSDTRLIPGAKGLSAKSDDCDDDKMHDLESALFRGEYTWVGRLKLL